MMKLGFVGWRGMVGSVLLNRMRDENDFSLIEETVFFTTSQKGQPAPMNSGTLQDASPVHHRREVALRFLTVSLRTGHRTARTSRA